MLMNIAKSEYEFASAAIEKILSQPVEQIELSDGIPPLSDVTDSNKVFKGKLSILFVDMRKSTDLADKLKSKKMVKIYRSFIRLIIQAIRYSGGYSRQFAGDGIMGVFQDSIDNDVKELSSQKAIKAARYITTLVDYCLNPLLYKHMSDVRIACGVGICTGTIMIAKAGMKGKETDDSCENELGIVWVGSTTNYANRYCSLANAGEIFIDDTTYNEAKDNNSTWVRCSRVKGTKTFRGYLAKDYYLELDENIETDPIQATFEDDNENTFIQDIFEQAEKEALSLIDAIAKKSSEVAVKLSELHKKEEQIKTRESANLQNESRLNQWQNDLNTKQSSVDNKAYKNKVDEYELNKTIFSKTFCKDSLIIQLGKDFWIDLISKMISLGKAIGKTELNVKNDLDCYLVDIYAYFGMYEEAYDALCIQAEYGYWLSISTVENIVKKSQHWARLKGILEQRINPGINKTKNDYLDALQKLKYMGY